MFCLSSSVRDRNGNVTTETRRARMKRKRKFGPREEEEEGFDLPITQILSRGRGLIVPLCER